MPESQKQNQMWERLVYAAVTAGLLYFGGSQTVQVREQKDTEIQDMENYRQFILYTMKNCTCEEE